MVKLTFYGGVAEIGGNKILVEDHQTRIMLDFGMSFTEHDRFYSEPWLSPRDERSLLEFDILPKLDGLYRFDDGDPGLDAVVLSHSHADHAQFVSLVNRKITIYCGETTAKILKALAATRPKAFDNDLSGLEFRSFRTKDRINIGSITVEPIHVDHSVPGAYGFILETSGGSIAYTGDLRVHGTRPEMTQDFVKKAKQAEPIALLCEGTNMMGGQVSSESEVQSKVNRVISETQKIVMANFSVNDMDRLRTFHEAARENDRYLAISLKQAYMLRELKSDPRISVPHPGKDKNILVFRRDKKTFYKWEQKILEQDNVKDAGEIKKMQKDIVLVSSFSDLREMIGIRPESGSSFILSSSEPFNEEMEIEHERFINWLDHFGLPMYHIHCSGHIMPNELKKLITEIEPKRVFPIHTDHPELMERFIRDVAKVSLPQRGAAVEL